MGTSSAPALGGPISLGPHHDEYFAEAVRRAGGELVELTPATAGLVWLSYDKADDLPAVLETHPALEWVQLPWAGVDAFASTISKYATPERIFTSAKGSYAQPVAEHALGLLLALLRSLPHRARLQHWESEIRGVTLHGASICILGGGGITHELIRILQPFGCDITVVSRSGRPMAGATRVVSSERLAQVLPTVSVLIVAAALTPETRGMIDAQQVDQLPEGAVLVNIARGPIVSTLAIQQALESGHLAGAALDVTDPEPLPAGHQIWNAPNVLITPHQADTPEMTRPLLAARIEENVRAFLAGTPFVGIVDPALGY